MEYKSVFDFLKNDERFDDVYKRCIEMEKSIIDQSDYAPFTLGRSASEAVITIVAKNNPELYNRFFKYDDDYSFSELLHACKNKNLISGRLFEKYKKLKNWGNSTVHVDEDVDFLDKFKKDHRYLFDVSKHCYNLFHDDELIYEYYLDNYDYRIETYEEQRNHQIETVRFNEVSSENLMESFKLKNIFIPKIFIDSVIDQFKDNIIDKTIFDNDIKDFEYVDDENLESFLEYFDDSIRNDVEKSLQELYDELSKNVLKTLNGLKKSDFTFNELNSFIRDSDDSNQKQIFIYIKSLADDVVKTQIKEYKKEIENSPITKFAENGRKLLDYKNYKIVEDDYGFSLEEAYENIFLDEKQNEAVEYDGEKPLVINAGPGSGKTRVIVERVVHFVEKKGIDPSTILVITFTRKATQELRDRLINETDLDVKDINKIRISTVHGFCRYLINKYEPIPYNYLTRHGERSLFFKKHKFDLGFKKYAFLYDHWIPGVLDEYDKYFSFGVDTNKLVNVIKNTIAPFEQHYKSPNNRYKRYIDEFYRNNDISENPNWKILESKRHNGPSYYYRWLNVAESYPKFLETMEDESTCDENTVLTKANAILENEYILKGIQYTNILIDEFQDTDHNQMKIFEKLSKIAKSFTVVGDVDQSIYGWRGAFPEFFEKLSKNAKNVTLNTNYRSTRNIVEFNEELIRKNRSIEKELKSKKKYHAPIYHLSNKTVDDEAINIVRLINNLMNDKKIKYYSDVAVLFRRNKSVDNLINPLEIAGIPYHLKENNDFLDQNEIKAMLLLFWYVMPYDKFRLNHLGDDFLNLAGFKDSEDFISNHFFRLSDETQDLLFNIENEYQNDLRSIAREVHKQIKGYNDWYSYKDVFDLEDKVKEEIFRNIETFDIGLLDKEGLIKLGITNKNDLDFFLKLNNLKSRIFSDNPDRGLTTLKLFYELLNVTDYFSEISIENNPDDIKIKDNLALFSHIIKDYESIMGDTDYLGLFTYLNRVLKGYSCRQNELDEGFNKVHLLSMHSAKGLEYPVVILGSLKENMCPLRYGSEKELYSKTPNFCFEYKNNDDSIEAKKYHAEEIRTIYVATTRAKEILVLSSIGMDSNDVPEFLGNLKRNPNTKIKLLNPDNVSIIPKIQSSKVFKLKNDFPKVKFENIVDDYLYCPYRYDLANNTRFKVKLRNDKYVNMVLLKLLNSIHGSENIDLNVINKKIDAIIKYHNISSSNIAYDIIKNVRDYWESWGKNYKILDSNIKILSRLKYCDLNSTIDLVIEDDNKISLVHFIGSDTNIPNIEMYKGFLLFYVTILKEFDEYKDKEFSKVYLHSLENNKCHEIEFDENMEVYVLEYLEEFTKSIYDNEFIKIRDNCSNCEYYGSVCKG